MKKLPQISEKALSRAILKCEYRRIPAECIELEKAENLIINIDKSEIKGNRVYSTLSFARVGKEPEERKAEYTVKELKKVLNKD